MALWPSRRQAVSAAPVRVADDPEAARRWLDEAAGRAGFMWLERQRETAAVEARIALARRARGSRGGRALMSGFSGLTGSSRRLGSQPADRAAVVSAADLFLKFNHTQLALNTGNREQFADTLHVAFVGSHGLVGRRRLSLKFLNHVHAPTIGDHASQRKARRMRLYAVYHTALASMTCIMA